MKSTDESPVEGELKLNECCFDDEPEDYEVGFIDTGYSLNKLNRHFIARNQHHQGPGY